MIHYAYSLLFAEEVSAGAGDKLVKVVHLWVGQRGWDGNKEERYEEKEKKRRDEKRREEEKRLDFI